MAQAASFSLSTSRVPSHWRCGSGEGSSLRSSVTGRSPKGGLVSRLSPEHFRTRGSSGPFWELGGKTVGLRRGDASPSKVAATGAAALEADFSTTGTDVSQESSTPGIESVKGPAAAEGLAAAELKPQFVWEAQWYPITLLRDLDKRIPEAVTILNIPLVVWWDRTGQQFRVFEDRCPHRLAPLSEGRIHESGGLQCTYHGWTFQGEDGACINIPQAPKDGPPVQASPRACARVFPTKEHEGILWFWAQHGEEGARAAAAAPPPPSVPMHTDPTFHVNNGQAQLNYGYEILVENLSDPAHVPVAHHGIQGNRNKAKPLDLFVDSIGLEGFLGGGIGGIKSFRFSPPCLGHLLLELPQQRDGKTEDSPRPEKQISAAFYCIPQSPGRARLIFLFANNFLPPIARKIPRWFSHISSNLLVLDSDHLMLHLLEKRLAESSANRGAVASYYTPTKSDAFVVAFRKWLVDFAGSKVQWARRGDLEMPQFFSKQEVMDRQQNHMKICQSCKGAQKGFEALKLFLQVASYAGLAVLALLAALHPARVSTTLAIGGAFLSMVCGIGSLLVQRFIQRNFYFHDYVHALVP